MRERGKDIVINTGPVIALVAALGELNLLNCLYNRVLVPYEVCDELTTQNASRFAAKEFQTATGLEKRAESVSPSPLLRKFLDRGEAAVIQLAMDTGTSTVCIDEPAGRRIARMSELSVTGSLGILLRAKNEGYPVTLKECIARMQERHIHLSKSLISKVLNDAGEREF